MFIHTLAPCTIYLPIDILWLQSGCTLPYKFFNGDLAFEIFVCFCLHVSTFFQKSATQHQFMHNEYYSRKHDR